MAGFKINVHSHTNQQSNSLSCSLALSADALFNLTRVSSGESCVDWVGCTTLGPVSGVRLPQLVFTSVSSGYSNRIGLWKVLVWIDGEYGRSHSSFASRYQLLYSSQPPNGTRFIFLQKTTTSPVLTVVVSSPLLPAYCCRCASLNSSRYSICHRFQKWLRTTMYI